MEKTDFTEITRKYGKRIYNLAFRICGNVEDAKDITQEIFIIIHKKIDSFRDESDLFTWIYRIAVNTSLRYKTKINKQTFDSLDEQVSRYSNSVPDEVKEWESTPEKRYLMDAGQ
jgi:RNA polymerase sigma-70 factor (ECF subfamily)